MNRLALLIVLLMLPALYAQVSPPPYSVSAGPGAYPTMPGATAVNLGDDDLSAPIYPNLYIRLFGANYTSFRIGSNGYILLGNQGTTTSPAPAHSTDGPAISPFWADLVPSAGGTVSWLAVGYNTLFVEWRNVPVRVGSDISTYGVTVGIEIDCVSLTITCHYQTPSAGGFTALPTSTANSVAISKPAGATSYQIFNGVDAGYIASNGAVTNFPAGRLVHFAPYPIPMPPIQIVTANPLPIGEHGVPYNTQMQASGGVMPYAGWSSGGLPSGWSLNLVGANNQAEIDAPNGADVEGGVYQVWIEVWSGNGSPQGLGLESFLIPVNPPHGVEGQAYSYNMKATGGFTPHTWGISGQPSWLNLNSNGSLTSTSPPAGTFQFNVTVSDNSANPWVYNGMMELVIDPGALAITTPSSLPNGTEYTPYSLTFQAGGGVQSYSWAATGLPAGWQLSAGGQLSAPGSAVQLGSFAFDVSVTDSDPAGPTTVILPCTLTVDPLPPLIVTTSALADATQGIAYSAAISAVGGSASGYGWSLLSGALPPGITGLPGSTPDLTLGGAPSATGLFAFEVQVTDDVGNTATAQLSIQVQAPSLTAGEGGEESGGCTVKSGSAAAWWWLMWFVVAWGLVGRRLRRAA